MCIIIFIHYSGLPLFKNIAPTEEKKKINFNTDNEIVLRYFVHLLINGHQKSKPLKSSFSTKYHRDLCIGSLSNRNK
jgi:hypothetical protein